MKGLIVGCRRGPKSQNPRQALVRVVGIKGRDVMALVGRRVSFKDRYGNEYKGVIIRHHGLNGVVRVRFEPNLPGQAIGGVVEIADA